MSDRFSPPSSALGLSRTTVIVGGVVLFHVAALWALQTGLIRKTAEVIIPVEILSTIIDPPKPPPPPPPPAPPPPPKKEVVKTPPPPPRPRAVREPKPAPAPNAPVGVIEPPPPPAPPAPPPPPAPPVAPLLAPPAPPAPKLLQLNAGQVQWVRKPGPVYPTMSRKLGEVGTVVIAVYFGSDGSAKRGNIATSSGFERLDRAALDAVLRSQITPLTGGNDQTVRMFNAPISFTLS